MSLLLGLVRAIDERCKNLHEEMVATKAEGRGLLRHARGCTSELVSEDGAPRRDSGLHCLDEDVDAPAIERRKPVRLNQTPLSVDDVRVERGQRRPIADGVQRVIEHRSKPEKRRHLRVALARWAAVGTTKTKGAPSGPATNPSWTVKSSGIEAAMSMQPSSTDLALENG